MGDSRRYRILPAIATALIVLTAVPLLADPGFGVIRKRKIDLNVRRPALIRLANTSIAFRGNVANKEYSPVLGSLEATLETELVSNERTLVKKPAGEAEWVLQLNVTGFSVPAAQKRTERVQNNTITYVRWTGSLNVAYQVVDRNGRVHDADNVSDVYDREVDANASRGTTSTNWIPGLSRGGNNDAVPRSEDDVKQILVQSVVLKIASNLGNTVQVVEAQVAAGDDNLDRAADFLTRSLWARAIEELEKTKVYPRPEHESYRQYNLGLAYEAMSYESKSPTEQRANLFKAQEYYDKAAELNRGQRYFVDVVARTKDSIARYRTLDAMQKEDLAKRATAVTKEPAAATNSNAAAVAGKKLLTLNEVIELHSANVPQADIIQLIKASAVELNLDAATLLAIAKAKLPVPIQTALRQQAGLPLVSGSPAPPAPRQNTTPPRPQTTKPTSTPAK